MSAERLLARLELVRQAAPARWTARCPSHPDKRPSLSIRELEDGRVLLHCFGACSVGDVLAAVGLQLTDLFPERISHHMPPGKPNHWHAAREALKVLNFEVLVVAIAAEMLTSGTALDD